MKGRLESFWRNPKVQYSGIRYKQSEIKLKGLNLV